MGANMAKDIKGLDQEAATLARQEAKEKRKAEKRVERYDFQRGEESTAWEGIREGADNMIKEYAKRGRPLVYDWNTIEAEIIDRLANGQSLASICTLEHMPKPSVIYVRLKESPSFAETYARARASLADTLFDQCLTIADDSSRDMTVDKEGNLTPNNAAIARDKLRIDTRLRMAGKMSSKYADKPLLGEGASVTMNNLTVNARDMQPSDRDKLRALLTEARDRAQGAVIEG
jgi:hypothetical protein